MENQTNIVANRKEILDGVLFRKRAEYRNMENKKILGVSAQTRITGYETLSGAVKVDLRTIFRLLFREEDGSFSHDTVEIEETESVVNTKLQSTSFVCLDAVVTSTSHMGSTLQATIEVSGWFIAENEVSLLNACIPGVYCKTEPIKVESTDGICPGGLTLTYTDESRMNIKSLLDYCPKAVITNVFAGSGSYRIEGDVYIRILAQAEDGQCFSQLLTHSFSTEVAEDKISADSDIDVDVSLKSAELSLADGDKRMLICDVVLSFCGSLTKVTETETVVDAYSETNDVVIKKEEVTVNEAFCLRALREKISYKIAPNNGINELFGFLCPSIEASYSSNNGSVAIEGIIETDMLYLSAAEATVGQKAEIPFKVTLPIDYKCESKMQPKITITNITAKLRGGEVDVLVEMLITIKGISDNTLSIVSGMEMGAEKEDNDFAVSLYIVRSGETLWDVAKALNVSEDVLLGQNSDVPLPLQGGERIILYKGIQE